jgi:hypothetical protein
LWGSLSSLWAQTSTVESNVFSVDTRRIFASNVFSVDTRDDYTVSFDLGAHGTHSGGGALAQTVVYGESAIAPTFDVADGWVFDSWSAPFDSVTADLTVTAQMTTDNTDADNDGLSYYAEVVSHHTDPTVADSDGDGLSDGAEVNQYTSNPIASDTDGDGILDGIEVRLQAAAAGFDLTIDSSAVLAEFISLAASVPGLLTNDQVEALRLGGIELDAAANGVISVQFVIEESTDLSTWTKVETINIAVDNGSSKKFIRVRKP